jgi:branched-chain amino acid transport system permease protein
MTYRSSGVVNFAHAATGTYLAFAFFEFRETGDLVLPLFAIPHRIPLFPRPTVAAAIAVFIVYCATPPDSPVWSRRWACSCTSGP